MDLPISPTLEIPITERQVRPSLVELLSQAPTDARTRPGDDGDLTSEVFHFLILFSTFYPNP